MSYPLENLNFSLDSCLESFIGICHTVPAILFVFLIIIGLACLFFGAKIYRIALGVFSFVIGCSIAYGFSENIIVSILVGFGAAAIVIILQFAFAIVMTGLVFGTVTYTSVIISFRLNLPILVGIIMMILGVYAALKLYKLIVIVTTSMIGAVMVPSSVLVLKYHASLLGKIDMREVFIDDFQMAVGFAALLLVGVTVQGASWVINRNKK